MSDPTLEDALQSAETPMSLLRDLGLGRFTDLPDEFTNWIEEQRARQEGVALAAEIDDPAREKVTLVRNSGDVVDAFASPFNEG